MLGTVWAFAYRHRETKKNLCRGGRSQDLPNTDTLLYNILYTVSTQQHQYSNIMYAIGYITLYHYIDVVVYWRYVIYYATVIAQRDGFCPKENYYTTSVHLHFWNYSGDRGSHVGQPWLKNAKLCYKIKKNFKQNSQCTFLSCQYIPSEIQFNSIQFINVQDEERGAK